MRASKRMQNPRAIITATLVALQSFHVTACGSDFKSGPTDAASVETSSAPRGAVSDPVLASDERASRDFDYARNPKSAVIFVGDGMGVSTVTAGRIHAGQKRGVDGESFELAWEDFPEVALVKTYNYDAQVADSAGTATAIFSGYRARIGQVNVPPVLESDESPTDPRMRALTYCASGPRTPTLASLAKASGRRVGVVSTARITHATPAAVYGHSYNRSWEAPSQVPEGLREAGCTSLGEQLAEAGLDLVMGGGARLEGVVDFAAYNPIEALDAITLPALRLYADSHMSYEADRKVAGPGGEPSLAEPSLAEPSLAEMTEAAMAALGAGGGDEAGSGAESGAGYLLVVEAGRIDHAHHDTNAYRALEDLDALHEAVAVAERLAGEDTLIVVTADHGHVFTQAGYPVRNNPILGLVHSFDPESRERMAEPDLADDGKPYTTLSYANGPVLREEVDWAAAESPDFRQPAGLRMESETHSGEDVPLYATGPGSELFGGVMDQPEVGQAIQRALGLTD